MAACVIRGFSHSHVLRANGPLWDHLDLTFIWQAGVKNVSSNWLRVKTPPQSAKPLIPRMTYWIKKSFGILGVGSTEMASRSFLQ